MIDPNLSDDFVPNNVAARAQNSAKLKAKMSDDYGSADLTWWEEAIAWVLAAILAAGLVRLVWWLL